MSGNKGRPHHAPQCTRAHQIGALFLVAATFLATRLISDRQSCPVDLSRPSLVSGGDLSWPQRGYGTHLELKVYVYDENEVDGLKDLLYGRDHKITAVQCLKGQWGTQVISLTHHYVSSCACVSIYPCLSV